MKLTILNVKKIVGKSIKDGYLCTDVLEHDDDYMMILSKKDKSGFTSEIIKLERKSKRTDKGINYYTVERKMSNGWDDCRWVSKDWFTEENALITLKDMI